ncbi:DUF6188 family protein [Nocardia sp. NPDC051750]|uniref:DUF6188 family protein n=1 Tax=Nocardia sp. NPDC051750 TaxID=3364325 RepID=UPI0037B50121
MAGMILSIPDHSVELAQLTPILVLRAGSDFEVQVESIVKIRSPDQAVHSYQVGELPEEIGRQLTGKVREAQTTDDGGLRLEFESGWSAEAVADADYEAWNVVGTRGFRVVCMPGGELAVWHADE